MKVHLMGIGGAGVSSLARVLAARGDAVSGCDLRENDTTAALAAEGVRVLVGHSPEHAHGQDLLVRSAAVSADAPEVAAARTGGVRVLTRAEMLAELIRTSDAIAVAGTHGKTTTTYMLGSILEAAGWDPSVLVGDGRSTRAGKSRWLVAEADESDGSLILHHPRWAIVTNVELDHPDHFPDVAAVRAVFAAFLAGLPADGVAVVPADDPELLAMRTRARLVTFGIEAGDYRWPEFEIELEVPGRHNRLNACAAAAIALELGVDREAIATALAGFKGAHRRLERIGSWRGAELYDDYGHHPTEVRATVAAARELLPPGGRLVLVFQPHRYTRFAAFRDEFRAAFAGADEVLVAEIYSAGEQNPDGLSSAYYGDLFAPDVAARLDAAVRPGDLVLFMGAGDIYKVPHDLAQRG